MLQYHYRHSVSLSNSQILEGGLIWPAGQYCCPFTSSVRSTAFFLPLSLVDSLHFSWWSRKSWFYSICRNPTAINRAADTFPSKPPVSGDPSTDAVQFPEEDVTFWESSLFWWYLSFSSACWNIRYRNTLNQVYSSPTCWLSIQRLRTPFGVILIMWTMNESSSGCMRCVR